MKHYITIIATTLFLASNVSAQDSYYYYHDTKVPLMKNSSKIVTILPKSKNEAVKINNDINPISSIADSFNNIMVYDLKSYTNTDYAMSLSEPASSMSILPCYISEDGYELIPNGYINIKLKSESDYTILETIANQNNLEIIGQNSYMPLWYNLRFTSTTGRNPVDIANEIYETGNFASAFPSFTFDALEISYDPNVYDQWGLYNSSYEDIDISISQAWSYATGRGIKVAIVDQGIDLNHQDLRDNIYPLSYDTETGSSPSQVMGNHGTHCAGIVAAVRNNGIQIAGVAPDAKLMSISNSLNGITNIELNLANGINWAWRNGADIISCSWWCPRNSLLDEAISNAVTRGREGKGCVIVKSAGNTGGKISYPGDYTPNVLAVANMKKDGTLSSSSAHGSNLFVAAPGTNILSTIPKNRLARMCGTSMACPHVAGVAALILERNPSLTAKKVREIIGQNAKKIGTEDYVIIKDYGSWNEYYGYGLVDAYKSVINTPRR